MKYTYNNKVFNIPDEEIDKAVEKLDCSIAEACEMYLTDRDLIKDETVEELSKKATKNRITATIHDAKGEKKERKPKEKKENPLKKSMISAILEGLNGFFGPNAEIFVRNDQKYIDISYENRTFTVDLVEHTKKKKG